MWLQEHTERGRALPDGVWKWFGMDVVGDEDDVGHDHRVGVHEIGLGDGVVVPVLPPSVRVAE